MTARAAATTRKRRRRGCFIGEGAAPLELVRRKYESSYETKHGFNVYSSSEAATRGVRVERGTVAIYKGVGQPLWGSDVEVPGWLASVLLDTSARDFRSREPAPRPGTWPMDVLEALGTHKRGVRIAPGACVVRLTGGGPSGRRGRSHAHQGSGCPHEHRRRRRAQARVRSTRPRGPAAASSPSRATRSQRCPSDQLTTRFDLAFFWIARWCVAFVPARTPPEEPAARSRAVGGQGGRHAADVSVEQRPASPRHRARASNAP